MAVFRNHVFRSKLSGIPKVVIPQFLPPLTTYSSLHEMKAERTNFEGDWVVVRPRDSHFS
ncbi:MAG: hypothetical protein KAU41_08070 [Deltaproteobacteria bacterium]|nr:hypothetical protein [Deltaproteobacteria bacterium]